MSRHPANIVRDIYLCRTGMAHASGARYASYREQLQEHFQALRDQAAPGQYWRVRVGGGKMLGKIRSIAERSNTIFLVRVKRDGDEVGASDELHIIAASRLDLVEPMEMDQYYGEIVKLGTAKRHICNHNLEA